MKRVKNYALKPYRVNMSNESLYKNNGHIPPKIWVKILRSAQWAHKKYSEIVLTTVLMPLSYSALKFGKKVQF